MERKFEPGDVVTLKSGGPQMVVEKWDIWGATKIEGYKCKWFEKETLKEDVFTEDILIES